METVLNATVHRLSSPYPASLFPPKEWRRGKYPTVLRMLFHFTRYANTGATWLPRCRTFKHCVGGGTMCSAIASGSETSRKALSTFLARFCFLGKERSEVYSVFLPHLSFDVQHTSMYVNQDCMNHWRPSSYNVFILHKKPLLSPPSFFSFPSPPHL